MSDNLHVLKPGIDIEKAPDMQPQADDATKKLYDEVAPAIVKIRGKDDAGSGFFIDKKGDIATDAHVVLGESQLDVITADGQVLPAKIKAVDDVNDVAIISVDKTPDSAKVLPLAPDEKLNPDDHLWAVGHPLGLNPIYMSPGYYRHDMTPNALIAEGGKEAMAQALQTMFEMTPAERQDAKAALGRTLEQDKMHVEPGNSGGPVIDADGKVIGLADATDNHFDTYTTPVQDLVNLMNQPPKFTFGYKFVPADQLKNPMSQTGEYILTDISRTDGDYRPPYQDPFFGDSWKIPGTEKKPGADKPLGK